MPLTEIVPLTENKQKNTIDESFEKVKAEEGPSGSESHKYSEPTHPAQAWQTLDD